MKSQHSKKSVSDYVNANYRTIETLKENVAVADSDLALAKALDDALSARVESFTAASSVAETDLATAMADLSSALKVTQAAWGLTQSSDAAVTSSEAIFDSIYEFFMQCRMLARSTMAAAYAVAALNVQSSAEVSSGREPVVGNDHLATAVTFAETAVKAVVLCLENAMDVLSAAKLAFRDATQANCEAGKLLSDLAPYLDSGHDFPIKSAKTLPPAGGLLGSLQEIEAKAQAEAELLRDVLNQAQVELKVAGQELSESNSAASAAQEALQAGEAALP